jgi:hypothetical protein
MFSHPDFHKVPTLKKVLCDGGYTGENFAAKIQEVTGAEVESLHPSVAAVLGKAGEYRDRARGR